MAIRPPPKLEQVPLPPSPGLLGGWGQKLEHTLQRIVIVIYGATVEPISDYIGARLNYYVDRVADEVKPWLIPVLDAIDQVPNLPPPIKNITTRLRGTPALPLAIIATVIGLAVMVLGLVGIVGPLTAKLSTGTQKALRPSLFGPAEAFAAWKRQGISADEFNSQLAASGWSDDTIAAWQKILAPLVGVGDLGLLLLRGELSDGEFNVQMGKRGYTTEEIGRVKVLLKVIPPLGDIIRMAVREAFTPDVVARFQLHAELPADMVAWAKKQGLSEEWARAYWAAHWELPSLSMGFEMLHREVISESDMRLLIKTHDVSPFWRDKLTAISYSPYTRVDVRRMYEAGILSKEQVYRSYRDIGYDHEKATNMTAFTIALSNATERDLTKAEVLTGFRIGFFTTDETTTQLLNLGYDATEADYYISKVMYDLWQAEIKEMVKYVGLQYVANQIDQSEVYSQLGRLNLPAEQINRYIRQWDVKRASKVKRLTADRLLKFRTLDVIDDDQFTNEMLGIGYSEKYVGWYLDAIHMGG